MALRKRFAYAVCPRLEVATGICGPKLFRSQAAAKRFLNSEVRFPLEPEAELTGMTVSEIRARRSRRKEELKQERQKTADRIRSGELPSLALLHLQPILNRHQGWQDPVPIRRLGDYSGARCTRTLCDFLPVHVVGPVPRFNLREDIERALSGRSADFTCYLDAEWGFAEIEDDALRRVGHEYTGRCHGGVGELVLKAAHDLDAAFRRLRPDASCTAVADFWCSWQVQHHIADFCARLAESETASSLVGNGLDAAKQVRDARIWLYRQLATFAHELRTEVPVRTEGANSSAFQSSDVFRFQVALSFPGEYRARVKEIAALLAENVGQERVLYDEWHRAEFARPNLDVYLPELYQKQSLLLVFFLCAEYAQKEWCGLEWRAGRDLLKRGKDDQLMFLRLNHADIPGLYSTDGYLDIGSMTNGHVAAEILKRLSMAHAATAEFSAQSSIAPNQGGRPLQSLCTGQGIAPPACPAVYEPVQIGTEPPDSILPNQDQLVSRDSVQVEIGDARLASDELVLKPERRETGPAPGLVMWLENSGLKPLDDCSLVMEGLQTFSVQHNEFRSPDFTEQVLVAPTRLNPDGASIGRHQSDAVTLARINNPDLTELVVAVGHRFQGVRERRPRWWRTTLLVKAGARVRREVVFFRWKPGQIPELAADPRVQPTTDMTEYQ